MASKDNTTVTLNANAPSPPPPPIGSVWRDGVWRNNAGLVQLLGLCPMLAVTTTLAYGIGLGIATTLVLVLSNLLVSLTRTITASFLRIPVYVLLIASLVTAIDILLHAYLFELHRVLGLFVPLIVTNCAIIARAEAFASRQPVGHSMVDGLAHGIGFTLVLMVLGFARELIGAGTIFAGMDSLFGAAASGWAVSVHSGFLLLILPPGAFLALGMLLALRNVWTARDARRSEATASRAESVA